MLSLHLIWLIQDVILWYLVNIYHKKDQNRFSLFQLVPAIPEYQVTEKSWFSGWYSEVGVANQPSRRKVLTKSQLTLIIQVLTGNYWKLRRDWKLSCVKSDWTQKFVVLSLELQNKYQSYSPPITSQLTRDSSRECQDLISDKHWSQHCYPGLMMITEENLDSDCREIHYVRWWWWLCIKLGFRFYIFAVKMEGWRDWSWTKLQLKTQKERDPDLPKLAEGQSPEMEECQLLEI